MVLLSLSVCYGGDLIVCVLWWCSLCVCLMWCSHYVCVMVVLSRVEFLPANTGFSHHAWLKLEPGKTYIYINVLCDRGCHIYIGHLTPPLLEV